MIGDFAFGRQVRDARASFDTLIREADERARQDALAAFARTVGIPGHLTIPAGIQWYLRERMGLDEAHAQRAYAHIKTRAVPTSVDGIVADLNAAIEATR